MLPVKFVCTLPELDSMRRSVSFDDVSSRLSNGVKDVKNGMVRKMCFPGLADDVQPMHTLQDWSSDEWQHFVDASTTSDLRLLKSLAIDWDAPDVGQQLRMHTKTSKTLDQWTNILTFQNLHLNRKFGTDVRQYYPHERILMYSMYRQLYPLGIDENISQNMSHAVFHSGIYTVEHEYSVIITRIIYSLMACGVVGLVVYLIGLTQSGSWDLNATFHNTTITEYRTIVDTRTKQRGEFASIVNALTFSLTVNACLDKFGKIDPSTSTVLIGMTLGGTWGFILDNLFGADEGFREYLWNPSDGMKYAMGSLNTERFLRYMITIFFDMFFTVVLFRQMYPLLLKVAGFSVGGREWIANGWVSGFISVLTFKVYANMTRFNWAYPSGEEQVFDQWISGHTMLLATIIMNMVYLTTETRTRQGESGINQPNVKIAVTSCVFGGLALLQSFNILDPTVKNVQPAYDADNVNLPLRGVCETKAKWVRGLFVYILIVIFCIGSVVFGTSRMTFRRFSTRRHGRLLSKMWLFAVFTTLTLAILLLFWTVPLFYASGTRVGGCS